VAQCWVKPNACPGQGSADAITLQLPAVPHSFVCFVGLGCRAHHCVTQTSAQVVLGRGCRGLCVDGELVYQKVHRPVPDLCLS
jgi:hypothetical protein